MASSEEMQAKMLQSIQEKTGIHPDEIIKKIKAQQFEKHGQKIAFVKSEYGLSHGFANLLAHKSKEENNTEQPVDLVEYQYKGKENLYPIYQQLIEFLTSLDGVEVAPKKSYVSLRTKKQFALIQPSTKKRIDIGLKFPKDYPSNLEKFGSFNSMVTHRIRIESLSDFNAEVKSSLEAAHKCSL